MRLSRIAVTWRAYVVMFFRPNALANRVLRKVLAECYPVACMEGLSRAKLMILKP
jgi:hypothetical protein